jgi:hypothetical protein
VILRHLTDERPKVVGALARLGELRPASKDA